MSIKNSHVKGFGSYGDILIRDRKMYVARTPFGIANGLTRQVTLISKGELVDPRLRSIGVLQRMESEKLLVAYGFDLKSNALTSSFIRNPSAGKAHTFYVYRRNAIATASGDSSQVEEPVKLLTHKEVEKEFMAMESSLDD